MIQQEREVAGGKGNTANFVWRCGNCKRESSAKFHEKTSVPKPYSVDSNGQFAPLIEIECRGLEFIGFDARVTDLHHTYQRQSLIFDSGNLEVRRRRIRHQLP